VERKLPKAVHIETEIQDLPILQARDKNTTQEEASGAFATLSTCNNGGVFAGSFVGESPWERHQGGDELVHVLKGETQLTILTLDGEGRDVLILKEGMLTVVPQSCWHRFHSETGVTVLSVTPQPTDHSIAEDPSIS
jgi:mannose-6-phosphate isomerase-like protein (cupin superfamily)